MKQAISEKSNMAKFGKLGIHKATGAYYVRIDGKMIYLTKGNGRLEDAEKKLEELKLECGSDDDGNEVSGDNATLGVLLNIYLERTKSVGCSKHAETKEKLVSDFLAYVGPQVRLKYCVPHQITAWLDFHEKWGNSYAALAVKHLSCAFNWLRLNMHTSKNPTHGMKRPQAEARGEECVLSRAEHLAILDRTKGVWKEILTVAWATGARPSELLYATCDEYRAIDHAIIKTNHKTRAKGKRRTILLKPEAEAIVATAVARHGTGLIFRQASGKPYTPELMRQVVRRHAKRLGINRAIGSYSYRHSAAVRWLEASVPIHIVASWLGNTVAVCERHYAHTLDRMRNTLALMPD